MIGIIATLCVFTAVLSAIYAVRAIIDERYKHNFMGLVFLTAILAVGAYWSLVLLIWQ